MAICHPQRRRPTCLPPLLVLIWLLLRVASMDNVEASARAHSHHSYSHMLLPGRHLTQNNPTCSPPFLVSPIYKTQTRHLTAIRRQHSPIRQMAEATDAQKLRLEFLHVLRNRRTPEVPLTVIPAMPVKDPLYQETPKPVSCAAMESCPKKDIPNFKELLKEENFYLTTEAGDQGRLPVLILSLKESTQNKTPAVVFLHSTNKCKEWLRPLLEAYASRGYVAVAIDSRYHGERASNMTTYRDALVSSWELGDTMPFIFDTVWDLIKLADYLTQREDIDPLRIGITGESLGGMHAWFAGFADPRYAVVVPIIGVQGFRWAIEHDKWQARVNSIKAVFEICLKTLGVLSPEARIDLGKSAIDKEVVEKVLDRIAPGLASKFDSPHTIPPIAPRPLLIVNAEDDPRCPIKGLEVPMLRALKAYEEANRLDFFELIAQAGIGHRMTPFMVKAASDWFDRFFLM